ncbi:putative F-box protein at1g23770 [Phtheirospermum japonicum]|uniref:Putative F-box protein at1g23770 n=1 Tax=Phtheirospermum japonicum TaxID=374723 RepID=A0A830BZL6_9LAMI|nr:putative F-box protein at1g23770 [Phtheirospermum japonicum]
MEVDDENNIETDVIVGKSFSVPGFLRNVFMAELGDDAGKDHKLIIVAVHAIMLETGFVGFDKNANVVVDSFRFRSEWPSSLFNMSLCYTLQESLSSGVSDQTVIKGVVLKFQTLGKFINVYGTLENGSRMKSSTYRVQLDEDRLVSFLNFVWANCGGEDEGILGILEKKVFEFWRTVKDHIALPLLIDLCEEIGLPLPPCFMRLPTDLKMRILESLPGADVAKASCVCSELRYLGSSDDLWKMKFVEEFGNVKSYAQGSWKKGFAKDWDMRKIRKVNRARTAPFGLGPYWAQRRRYPNPFMVPRVPRIIGGDYDIMGNLAPQCNFGARDDGW